MTLTFDLLTSKSIGRILDSWWVSVWSFMIIGWLQSQLSSGNHFQITMRHDLDLWPFDLKINRAHPWLMVSKCMKFHDHRWITESVIVRKLVWRTDRQTDRLTDRVQTYSPLRFHRWGTNNIQGNNWCGNWGLYASHISRLYVFSFIVDLCIDVCNVTYNKESD